MKRSPPRAHDKPRSKTRSLLAVLPAEEYARLLPHLELIQLPLGRVLCEPGVQMYYVYFPITGIISMLCVMQSGASAVIVNRPMS